MKKSVIFSGALALALAACTTSDPYKITVNFPDGSNDADTVFLTSYDSGDTIATALVDNHVAVIEGETDRSFMARLAAGGQKMGFVVEKGEITIAWQDKKVSGTPLNEKLNALDAELEEIEKTAMSNTTEAGAEAAERKMIERFHQAYEENKDNGIGPWAFNYYLMYNTFTAAQIDSALQTAPAHYKDLKRVQKAIKAAQQLELTAVGQMFTDFTGKDGKKLSDFAGTGKYTLVDFWASWCGPCRREIPNIRKLYDRFGQKMNFVGVAVWDNPDDTRKAMTDLAMAWPVIEGGKNWTEPTDLYGVSGIPHIMLIAPDGKILSRGLHGDELVSTVEELFR